LSLVFREGLKLVALGILAGVAGCIAATRLLQSLLYGVSATDPATIAVLAVALCLVALGACAAPAWRAMRIEPLTALRHE
ncbi:MAG: hypothetical protein ACRD9L_24765, partial [Bryobacteraceae bacterium]